MLHLILGTNKNKFEGAPSILRVDAFNWDEGLVRGKLQSSSLFGGEPETLVLDNISENAAAWLVLLEILPEIINSSEKVIIREQDLKKESLEVFENLKVEISDLREKKEYGYDFSPFALQDAVGERSAKHAWIEYNKLRKLGIEAEEIIPKIINKLRDMLSIARGVSKTDLNIKSDFPYNKSKRDLKNWPLPALKSFYSNLISLYHESRSAHGRDLSMSLEKELLQI
jgi:DNA polymerase III delta subunit